MNLYAILKAWYEFKAENHTLTGNHTDLFFYIIDLNNRLAWKEVFGLPSIETSNFLGMSYNTFRKVFNDLIELNIVKLVKKSNNQYAANQISIAPVCQNLLKQSKSTYKAFVKAQQKQLKSTCDIDRHSNKETSLQEEIKAENIFLRLEVENLKKQLSEKPKKQNFEIPTQILIESYFKEIGLNGIAKTESEKFFNFYESKNWFVGKNKMKNWQAACRNWKSNIKDFQIQNNSIYDKYPLFAEIEKRYPNGKLTDCIYTSGIYRIDIRNGKKLTQS